jgi:hypothetical protein
VLDSKEGRSMRNRSFIGLSARWIAGLALAFSAAVALTTTAEAGRVRFVASNGDDANSCVATAPCRTLQRGVEATPAGGELIVLGPGSYGGSLTIGKSITISAIGISATLGNPGNIVINRAGAVVALRGLHLQGAGPGATGIDISAAAAVRIEKCVIERFMGHGISLTSADAELSVMDTIVRDNSGGLFVNAAGAQLTVDNSRFEGNVASGIFAGAGESTITRTVSSGNGGHGIVQQSGRMNVTATTTAQNGGDGYIVTSGGQMSLESSVARGNDDNGLGVGFESSARISNSVFTNNGTGLFNNGILETRQNNTVRGNGTNVSGPLTVIPGT